MGAAAPVPQPVSCHQSPSGTNALDKGKRGESCTHWAWADTKSFPTEGEFYKTPLSQLAFKFVTKYKAVEFYVGKKNHFSLRFY